MKNILFFSPYYHPYLSGLTIYPKRLLDYLKNKNRIIILTFAYKKNLKKIEKKDNITIIRLNYWFKISKGFISPLSLLDFYQHLKIADIVLLNQPNFEGLGLALLAFLTKKRIISIVHCQVFLPKLFFNIIINLFLNFSFYAQLLLSTTILPTTEDYAFSLPWGKIFKNKIKAICPSIKKPLISQVLFNRFKKEKKRYWIGYAGRIASEKGLEYLISALTPAGWLTCPSKFEGRSGNRLPAGVELVFAGPYGKDVAGESSYYLKIKQLLEESKIKYRFLGNLLNGDLGAFYKAIDLLVLHSVNQTEAFGMVQVEAMMLGTPVVASNLPGVRIPIKLTKMGIVVEPKNSDKLTMAIKNILRNREKYSNKQLIENAKNIFDIKKTYKFYERLLY